MADILFELQQKVAMKPALEAKLRELQNQRREYDRETGLLMERGARKLHQRIQNDKRVRALIIRKGDEF